MKFGIKVVYVRWWVYE